MLHRSVRLRSSPYLLRDRITVLPFPHPFTTRAISAPAACGRLHPTPISRVRWTCHHLCYDRASFQLPSCHSSLPMLIFFTTLLATLSSILCSRAALELENLALRHQLGVLQRSARKRYQVLHNIVTTETVPLVARTRSPAKVAGASGEGPCGQSG